MQKLTAAEVVPLLATATLLQLDGVRFIYFYHRHRP